MIGYYLHSKLKVALDQTIIEGDDIFIKYGCLSVMESVRFQIEPSRFRFGSRFLTILSVRFEKKYSNVYRKIFFTIIGRKTNSCVIFLALPIKRAVISRTKNRTHVQGCTINKLN